MNSKITDFAKTLATGKFWKEFIIMTVGMIFTGIAVYYFLVPSKLIIGTISGFSIVLSGISEQVLGFALPVSTVILVINAILLVMAYFMIGKEFGAKTCYTALILGPIISVFETYAPYENFLVEGSRIPSVMGDPWFDLMTFVLMLSFAQAVLFRINASTGGLDILAKIVNKYLHFDIGVSVTVAGGLICCTAFAINPFHMVVMGLIGTWINGLVIDYFTAGLNNKKRVCIISPEHERLRNFIINDLVRGVTLYEITGGYSNEKKIEIEALLSKDEFTKLMKLITDEQINAFVTSGNVSEVYGTWVGKKQQRAAKHKL